MMWEVVLFGSGLGVTSALQTYDLCSHGGCMSLPSAYSGGELSAVKKHLKQQGFFALMDDSGDFKSLYAEVAVQSGRCLRLDTAAIGQELADGFTSKISVTGDLDSGSDCNMWVGKADLFRRQVRNRTSSIQALMDQWFGGRLASFLSHIS